MINAADSHSPARRSFFHDAITSCVLAAMIFSVWAGVGLADSTVGFGAGVVVASWPALIVGMLGPDLRDIRRPRRKDVHVQRAAQKVAAVVARSERSGRAG
ncbi:hypothetical protein [Baekduia sp. Peel2402]|uniref:hypothetical protein n=1 Tax=Baekduia sp. Peel2402 TaxID=3458296 RepID=UPI00403ECC32